MPIKYKSMKHSFLFFILLISSYCFSQDYSNYNKIKIETSEDCELVEPKVVECASYLLNSPIDENLNALNAIAFVMRWMEATPNHSFELGGELYMSISSDIDLVSRYLAAQAITAINFGSSDKPNFKSKYVSTFLEYCEKPENNVKVNSKIKKYIKAKNENKLSELLSKE